MNRKSGNNKYDIVMEAQAVLAAYNERCKVYEKRTVERRGKRLKCLVYGIIFGALFIWGACWLINLI